ncbi:trichohyalin-like [Macrobrachium nipponense]|uniref:trichohyalin-like n=1 Tax=Macrobrachium nipponense TaxID=159736 RepID=UPI0030C884B8
MDDEDEDSEEEEEAEGDNEDPSEYETVDDDEDSEEEETLEEDEEEEEEEEEEEAVNEEDPSEHETVEEEEDSEEEDTTEEDEDHAEEEKGSSDDDYEEEEKEEEKAKPEDEDDHDEFLEILGQFMNDPTHRPTEFPRPSLVRGPRRNHVLEAVLAMRGKVDRLSRENEKLQKERLDRLNLTEELQDKKDIEMNNMRTEIESLAGENSKLNTALLECKRRERELECQVQNLTEAVENLEETRTGKKEQVSSEVQGGTEAAELQSIIDKQADLISRLKKKLLEMEEERLQHESDFQEWEKTVYKVRNENSKLKVALEENNHKNELFRIFEKRNKVLEEENKRLKREMANKESKEKKEKSLISKEMETLRRQKTEAFIVRDEMRNEKESMARHILTLERENKDCKRDVAYFQEWFAKDYTNHSEDVEDCLNKLFEEEEEAEGDNEDPSEYETVDDDEDSEEEETVEEDEEEEEEEKEEAVKEEGPSEYETVEDDKDSEEEEEEAVEENEDPSEHEIVEEEEDSEEEDTTEEDEDHAEEEKGSSDDDYEEEEKEEEKAKPEDEDDHDEFLEILGQFMNDPTAPTEFPRPSLVRGPRRNHVLEAVLAMRGKVDRLSRENEKLQKERLDRLNLTEELQDKKDIEMNNMRTEIESLAGENSKLNTALLECKRRERELECQVQKLTEAVENLEETRTGKKEQVPSEVQGGTEAAELQSIIDKQADLISRLKKKLLEMEEERLQHESDFQEWEKTVYKVRNENSKLKVALEENNHKNELFRIFEKRNKVLEEENKRLKREMANKESKEKKEKSLISKEMETLRRQKTEAFIVRDEMRNEKESMARHILTLERENKDCKRDVAYFQEWFAKDYTNHSEDVEDCLNKLFEVSDRHQLHLKEKLQRLRNARDSNDN